MAVFMFFKLHCITFEKLQKLLKHREYTLLQEVYLNYLTLGNLNWFNITRRLV